MDTANKKKAVDVDHHVGRRIRERRIMLGYTQQELADMIGVTYQQAHKYERGINRISAGRLLEVARALSVRVDYFFEGLGENGAGNGTSDIAQRQRLSLEVARHFSSIENERHQMAFSKLAKALIKND